MKGTSDSGVVWAESGWVAGARRHKHVRGDRSYRHGPSEQELRSNRHPPAATMVGLMVKTRQYSITGPRA